MAVAEVKQLVSTTVPGCMVKRLEADDQETVICPFKVQAAFCSFNEERAASDHVDLTNSDGTAIDGTDNILRVNLVGTTTSVDMSVMAWSV